MVWNKLSNYCTTISGNGLFTNVVYHRTTIVKFSYDQVILNSGGWDTFTTKKKMNQASYQFNLGYTVYQQDFVWYVVINDNWENPIEFYDNMTFNRVDNKLYLQENKS